MKIQAPPPGSLIAGKYLVEGLLGVGGMGVVLTARHQQLDQKVAIKVLLPEVARHPEIVERFAREARAAAKIQGAHVARVLDVGVLDDGSPFMVMEHLDGRDLAAELKARGPLPVADVTHWIVEACEAIAQAHAAKIVHRDLKPSNLFLARQPDNRFVVKVLDFGISKIVDPDAPALTKTSSIVGTPYYMSPEQLTAAKTLDTRADIWALGVIMYELLVGTPPFTGESMPAVVAAILQNTPVPLDDLRPGLPIGFSEIVASCLKTAMGERYQSVATLAAALARFGSPRDQVSAERIARMLGMSNPQEESIPPTEPAPPAVSNPPAVERTLVLSEAPRSPARITGAKSDRPHLAAIAVAGDANAKTEMGVSTSVNDTPSTHLPTSGKRTQPIAIGIVVAALLGIGAWVALGRNDGAVRPDTVGTGSGTSATTIPITASSSTPSAPSVPSAQPSASTTPLTTILTPLPSAVTSASATPPVVPPHVVIPRASSGTVTTVPSHSTSPPASSPPPATSPSKNPLDMVIK